MTLEYFGPNSGARVLIDYDPGLIEAAEARRLSHCLLFLLKNGVEDRGQPVGRLGLMAESERQHLLRAAAGTAVVLPQEATLASLCAEQAARTPVGTAVICGTETIDFATLHATATALALRLTAMGVGLDCVVGIALPRTIDLVVAILGVHKAGAAYLPLDPAYPEDRIAYILKDANAPVVISTSALAAKLPDTGAQTILMDLPMPDSPTGGVANLPRVRPDNLAYVIYTSGSTGRPKGVGVEHRNAVNLIHFGRSLIGEDELSGFLFSTSLNFDLSVYELFLPLAFGGRIIAVENLLEVATAPARDDVRLINSGPSSIDALFKMGGCPKNVRTVNVCGEALLRPVADRVFAFSPDIRLINFYGPTETTVYSTWSKVEREDRRTPAIGKGLWNTQVYVLDSELELLPAGTTGELCIGGAGVARGYLNRPDLTDERFAPNPFGAGRIYRTGDVVRLRSDGELEFLGRRDNQIKIHGVRIELGEIETHLAAVPGIAGAVAVVRQDKFGVSRLLAYAKATDNHNRPGFPTVEAQLARTLPRQLIPSGLIWLDSFPMTPNGKLDRRALPAPQEDMQTCEIVPPRNHLERQIARIWEELLERNGIGVHEEFFGAGGDSLMAVSLLLEIEKSFGVRLPFDTIYGQATIERLAQYLACAQEPAARSAIVPLQALGSKPPFFCVHGIGGEVLHLGLLAKHLGTDRPFLGIKAPDLRDAEPILSKVEHMASHYVDEVLAHQRSGPFHLGGLSFGALVAYEMAVQLQKRGHQIGLLVLLDQRRKGWTLEFHNFFPTIVNSMRNIAPWFRHDAAFYGPREFLRSIQRKLKVWGHRLGNAETVREPDVSIMLDLARYAPDRHDLFRVLYRALLAYQPQSFRGRAVVFRAEAQPILRLWDEPALGWSKLIHPQPAVRVTPGNHRNITAHPNVSYLAEQLRECLDEADLLPVQGS